MKLFTHRKAAETQKLRKEESFISPRAQYISVELSLGNSTRRPIPISRPARRWLDLVSWKIYKNGVEIGSKEIKLVDLSAEIKIDSTGRPVAGKSVDMSILNPGEGVKKEIGITHRNGSGSPAGGLQNKPAI
uniref:Uncharacterized protein n=1 Tax=Oscillatoriales cyanobacterium SpSt-418 TaxID=2282169 RepID=A0A7C3PJY2_9CYAN